MCLIYDRPVCVYVMSCTEELKGVDGHEFRVLIVWKRSDIVGSFKIFSALGVRHPV